MWKRVAVTAAFGAAIVGAGGAALAAPGAQVAIAPTGTVAGALAASTAPSPSTPGTGKKAGSKQAGAKKTGRRAGGRGILGRAGRLTYATWVTENRRSGDFVTHNAIHGAVTAVSAASITVKAADGVSRTFVLTKDTKVRIRPAGAAEKGTKSTKVKATAGTIGQVHPGDNVLAAGTGTGTLTARFIVSGLRR